MGIAALALVEAGGGGDDLASLGQTVSRRHLASVAGGEAQRGSSPALVVLLVDDDRAMRMVCVVNLEAEGFRVLVAETGRQALALAAAERPDLVLLDVMLPDMGGFEVAAELRHLPIVFLSARGSESDLERGRQEGALDYVTKPFDPIGLSGRLREDLDEFARTGSAEQVWAMRFGPPSGLEE
jgi:DNA-binding response OmpR family regulator